MLLFDYIFIACAPGNGIVGCSTAGCSTRSGLPKTELLRFGRWAQSARAYPDNGSTQLPANGLALRRRRADNL